MAMDLRDPKVQKAFLGAVGGGAILYVYFFTQVIPFTYKANASELGQLEEKYRVMSKDLTKARQAAHQLPYIEKEAELLHGKWEQGRTMLPEKVDMTVLLRTITLLGTQSGIEFVKFKPLPPKGSTNYTENPIEIEVVGGYHQVGAFMSEIANLDRVINLTEVSVEANKDRDAPKEQPASASFVAVAYTIGNTAPPPPPETKTKVKSSKGKAQKSETAKKGKQPPKPAKKSRGGDE